MSRKNMSRKNGKHSQIPPLEGVTHIVVALSDVLSNRWAPIALQLLMGDLGNPEPVKLSRDGVDAVGVAYPAHGLSPDRYQAILELLRDWGWEVWLRGTDGSLRRFS
jgi:hypothetical protein